MKTGLNMGRGLWAIIGNEWTLVISMFVLGPVSLHSAEVPLDAPQCVVQSVEGRVEISRSGKATWGKALVNQILLPGDRLRTGFRSRATLQWSDLSTVRVKALTSLELQPPASLQGKPELDLKSGATYFFSREKPDEIRFRTPVASGAIRGTEFNLRVDEDGMTELALLDGEVTMENEQGDLELQSGQRGLVEPGGAPTRASLINAVNVIQWVLYYPVVIDPKELSLSAADQDVMGESVEAYAGGNLRKAMAGYPEERKAGSETERLWQAVLALTTGEVAEALRLVDGMEQASPLADALREMVAAVRHQSLETLPEPETASQWMARSYYFQSQSKLPEALDAARSALEMSPEFGAAWIRAAELEFSFGRTDAARVQVDKGMALSPDNAQGLALQGFLASAANQSALAMVFFERAIKVDGALGNAWLGRGLTRIRQGQWQEGRKDLQVAATLEPQRSALRSYLGKAFYHSGDSAKAEKEWQLARDLDEADPTPWLYSALLAQQENRVNDAVKDLETSRKLNDNRAVYRSKLLLDQDRAVRSANLASIYLDAGMAEVSFQEAARAVNYDYGNYSSHLFLANSFNALRDPKLINLRYETPWFSELLVSQLLAPPGGGTLSQTISQQEYSRFFEGDHVGMFSSTEYFSSGDWIQSASQYGNLGDTSYALDGYYRTENGQRQNNDLEQLNFSARVKQQLTEKDSVFLQASYFDSDSGDVAQYYNQNSASKTLRVSEEQSPNLLLGYHRQWAPGSHTLFLAGRFDDDLELKDSNPALLYLATTVSPFPPFATNMNLSNPGFFSLDYQSDLTAYSAELQHFWELPEHTVIVGGRYQDGDNDTDSRLNRNPPIGVPSSVDTSEDTDLYRISIYAYEHWQILDQLRLTAGISYDRLHYPRNIDTSPISSKETSDEQFSPKAGLYYQPWEKTQFRGIYTRSLGGVFFDSSVRLEPSQINGFNQAFRSLIPESVVGLVPGTEFDTFGLGWDQSFDTRTYLTVEGEYLMSDGDRTIGLLSNSDPFVPTPDTASTTRQSLDYTEMALRVTVNQLVGRDVALGSSYRLTHADLDSDSPVAGTVLNEDVSAYLHQVYLYAILNHPSGFFGQANAVWTQQSNQDYATDLPGDDFWQFNVYAGYRFWQRRMEARLGIMNLFDQNYRLNPLTLYNEMPRERTLAASFKFYF